MSVGFVQSVTASGNNVNTQTVTLTGVASGNAMALQASVGFFSVTNITPTDDRGNTWNTTTDAPGANGVVFPFICYALNCAAGDTVVTADYGTNYFIQCSLAEFSGVLTSAAIDQQTSNSGTSNAPTSGTTGTLAQADELILACLTADDAVSSNVGIDVPATTGYTNLHVFQDPTTSAPHSSDYKIAAATTAQSAAWGTLSGSYAWSGKIVTLKGAGAPPAAPRITHPTQAISVR